MNDLPLPDAWRDALASYPRELVFAAIAASTFSVLVLLARRPKLVLRGMAAVIVVAAGVAAGLVGTRTGVWAERRDEKNIAVIGGIAAVALVFALRLRGTLKKTLAHRRLVRDVENDAQKLLVLALAPEISGSARRRAVRLLDDPFTLDEIARRSRSSRVKKLAKRRLANARKKTRDEHAHIPADATATRAAETPSVRAGTTSDERSDTADGKRRDGTELDPESFYLPPEEER